MRRNLRYRLPTLTVKIDGVEYQATDWSLGGLAVEGYRGPCHPGAHIVGTLRIKGVERPLAFKATVVRKDRALGVLALRFHDLDDEAFDALGGAAARRLAER
jgi:hypothetical protein